jgi:muramoyltetrapeptide carboxypeptidase
LATLTTQTIFHKARALRPGDPVAAIAPAGPFDRESFEAGLAIIAERYRVQYDPSIFHRDRYLAGDDARRLAELRAALASAEVKAIFCVRGGYGTMRLLPELERTPTDAARRATPAVAEKADVDASLAGRGTSSSHAGGPHVGAAADTGHAASLHVRNARRLRAGTADANIGAAQAATSGAASQAIIGFSDITALHQWRQSHGLVSIHGPVLTQLGRLGRATSERLFSLLESDAPAAPLRGTATFVEGIAEGPLLGGNLSMFTRLLGTPFMPNLEGAILVFEDVGERPYRLDRMWTHLDLAGVFRQTKGIVLGSFTHCEERDASYSSQDVLRDLAVATGLPCATGFPIGHGDVNEPVPLGVRVRLDATTAQLTFLEAAVSEE